MGVPLKRINVLMIFRKKNYIWNLKMWWKIKVKFILILSAYILWHDGAPIIEIRWSNSWILLWNNLDSVSSRSKENKFWLMLTNYWSGTISQILEFLGWIYSTSWIIVIVCLVSRNRFMMNKKLRSKVNIGKLGTCWNFRIGNDVNWLKIQKWH